MAHTTGKAHKTGQQPTSCPSDYQSSPQTAEQTPPESKDDYYQLHDVPQTRKHDQRCNDLSATSSSATSCCCRSKYPTTFHQLSTHQEDTTHEPAAVKKSSAPPH